MQLGRLKSLMHRTRLRECAAKYTGKTYGNSSEHERSSSVNVYVAEPPSKLIPIAIEAAVFTVTNMGIGRINGD